MRFMMLMMPGGYGDAEPGTEPDPEHVAEMMEYNEALEEAGVLLDVNGLHPPSTGARVSFPGGAPQVTDGPFAETREVVGGYWIIEVDSKEEAVEWAKRCPGSEEETIEVRRVQETSDFSDEVRAAIEGAPP
jgi:hypothetical protein